MNAMAELVTVLMSEGCSADVVRSIVGLAEQHAAELIALSANNRTTVGGLSADVGGSSADSAHERRKEYDRNRQAEIRRLKRLSEKPPLILPSLSSEETLKEVSKEPIRARASKTRAIPADWTPSEHSYAVAEQHGVQVQIVEQIFRDYLKSSGKLYADYDAAFYNFLRNQRRFNGSANGTPQNKSVSAVAKRWAEQFAENQSGDSLEGNPDAFLRLSSG